MILRTIAHMLQICGTLMIFIGASVLPAQPAVAQQSGAAALLQPSPRPTIKPESKPDHNGSSGPGIGRITGTIIDLNTGAPTPGIEVNIGGVSVVSDSNGNYDLWIEAGPHSVALVLDPSHGTPAQGQQMVDVVDGATVLLHLNFTSVAPPTATPEAAAAPPATDSAPPPTPTAEPTAVPTSSAGGNAAPRVSTTARTRLPRTSEASSSAWTWIALGMFMVFGGIALELNRKRLSSVLVGAARAVTSYENARLLATLLARDVKLRSPEATRAARNDLLLSALLTTTSSEDEHLDKGA